MLKFELEHHHKPVIAMMGLAFKPDIDDLREAPAKYITTKVMQSCNNADILVVEPNVNEHKVFKLTDYKRPMQKPISWFFWLPTLYLRLYLTIRIR